MIEIKPYAFSNCTGLTGIVIPTSVTEIGDYVFSNCSSLTSIIIPSSVTKIGDDAFSLCTSLLHLTVDTANPVYCSENNILYTKDKKKLIAAAGGLKGGVALPDTVTEIADYAFWDCRSLTSVSIPDGVTWITEGVFSGCSGLTNIVIPNSVKVIDDRAFSRCSSLTSVRIPDSVTKIGDNAFLDCTHLTELTVDSENPIYCSEKNFLYTKDKNRLLAAAGGLKTVDIFDGVTEIADDAFYGCSSLTDVIIPDSVTVLDDGVFYGCTGLTRITIPANVTWIGDEAFSGCTNLKTVIIDSTIVEKIKDTAFENVHTDVHFTVKTDAVKTLLKKNSTIRDEQITVDPNANS